MLSRRFTLILAIIAIMAGSMAAIHLSNKDLGIIFGTTSEPAGSLLYSDFELSDVEELIIQKGESDRTRFVKRQGVWQMITPVRDRADYAILQTIIYAARHLRIEDSFKSRAITEEESGIRASASNAGPYQITLKGGGDQLLADFTVGRRSAWHRLDEEDGHLHETFFVKPREKSLDDHVYVCSSPKKIPFNIRRILDRGLSRLRDHHPVLIDQKSISGIRIRSEGREIMLSRSPDQSSVWRMMKPLETRTKPAMVNGLIVGLSQMRAIRIHERKSITIPPRPPGAFLLQLELTSKGAGTGQSSSSTILTIEPPAPPEADTVLATSEERPGLVFELPRNPVAGGISLAQLPLKVDQLRDRTLADFEISALRSMTIHQSTRSSTIHVFLGKDRTGRPRWTLQEKNQVSPANEARVAKVLSSLTRDEVVGFASNAAANLSRYGLSPPTKRILLELKQGEPVDIIFGRSPEGRCFAMRQGTSTVAEITPACYTSIAAEIYQWQDSLLMPFSIVDLSAMKIEHFPISVPLGDPALTLKYKFLSEEWSARQYEEDVTPELNKHRANQFLKFMEELRVEQWLNPASPAAARALRSPSFRLTAIFQELDEEGELKGFRESSFELAAASSSPRNRIFYGKVTGNPNYFVIGSEAYSSLKSSLLDTPEP